MLWVSHVSSWGVYWIPSLPLVLHFAGAWNVALQVRVERCSLALTVICQLTQPEA
jgi:hypothetical protein